MTTIFDKCILHIGTEKTGTTTLQAFLGENRAEFYRAGFFVPKSLSPYPVLANHERLTTYALQDDKINDDLRRSAKINSVDDVAKHRAQTLDRFQDEIAAIEGDNLTLLLSNEHCHSRLVETAEVSTLAKMLSRFATRFQIVLYIRPQHELATSLYDQALKAGYFDIDVIPFSNPARRQWVARRYFQYDDLVRRWETVFGRENITVRLFDRRTLISESIIDDFLDFLGLMPAHFKMTKDRNRSIGRTFQQALNSINKYASENPGAMSPDLREKLIDRLSRDGFEPAVKPIRAAAVQFFNQFSEGNESIRKAFFPNRAELFTPDYSSFPEELPKQPPDRDALVKALIHLLKERKGP